MKVTFKNGTVIEDVTTQELPFVLAMSNPAVVAQKITEHLASKAAPGLSWVNSDVLLNGIRGLFRDSPGK